MSVTTQLRRSVVDRDDAGAVKQSAVTPATQDAALPGPPPAVVAPDQVDAPGSSATAHRASECARGLTSSRLRAVVAPPSPLGRCARRAPRGHCRGGAHDRDRPDRPLAAGVSMFDCFMRLFAAVSSHPYGTCFQSCSYKDVEALKLLECDAERLRATAALWAQRCLSHVGARCVNGPFVLTEAATVADHDLSTVDSDLGKADPDGSSGALRIRDFTISS